MGRARVRYFFIKRQEIRRILIKEGSVPKDNVILSISHGFQVRNFLETKFLGELMISFNVIIVINDADKHCLGKLLERLGLNVTVEGVSIERNQLEKKFLFLRKNIFVSPRRANTKNILNELYGKELGRWRKLFSILNQIFGRFEFVRSLWRGVERLFIDGHEFDTLMKTYKPIKLITANYGTEPFEIRLLRAAKRHQIKSLAVVPSWDNLTSKGVMGIKPDYLLVWNEIMVEEAIELHAFTRDRVVMTGPLQFDNFFDPHFRQEEDFFHAKFKIEKGRPIIAFGTITPRYFKYNLDILEILREFIQDGRIKGNPKVVVRIHPQVVRDPILR